MNVEAAPRDGRARGEMQLQLFTSIYMKLFDFDANSVRFEIPRARVMHASIAPAADIDIARAPDIDRNSC